MVPAVTLPRRWRHLRGNDGHGLADRLEPHRAGALAEDEVARLQDLAQTREAAVRALDRVLISGYYAVPLFYLPEAWIARWNTVEHPEVTALTGPRLETWWGRQ